MADFDGGGMAARAAAHVDRNFQAQQRAMVEEHARQAQRDHARRQAEMRSFADNRQQAGERYAQRLRTIEAKRDRIAERMQQRHNSIGGRLRAMMPGGRAKQADERQRLNERAAQLQVKAGQNYEVLRTRQMQAEQKATLRHEQESRQMREQHRQHLQDHAQRHQQSRGQQIDSRTQGLRQVAEQQWQQAMKQEQARSR